MPGTYLATVGGRNRIAGSKLHISPIVIASILLFGGGEASWSQEKIGGAETVINNVQGNFPTGKQVPVVQGDSVFLNETFSTGADSKANLVLDDKSNVTVGPGSTLKLDDFVYSGAKQPGMVSFSITNGTLRFITGDANKRSYTILTPTAAIGARGTSLRLKATPTETQIINEEGTAIVCLRSGNENASVEELRKPCRGHEEDQASVTDGKSRSCPCTALLLPSAQATITASEIAVAAAPLNAISEPFIDAPRTSVCSPPISRLRSRRWRRLCPQLRRKVRASPFGFGQWEHSWSAAGQSPPSPPSSRIEPHPILHLGREPLAPERAP